MYVHIECPVLSSIAVAEAPVMCAEDGSRSDREGDLFVFHDDSFGVIAPGALERALIMVPNLGFDTSQHHRRAAR
jgi:hypothetical protein